MRRTWPGEDLGAGGGGVMTAILSSMRNFCRTLLRGIHRRVELRRLAARNAERLPVACLQVLGQKHNLSYVAGVMGELPIDRLHHSMPPAANEDRPQKVFPPQR